MTEGGRRKSEARRAEVLRCHPERNGRLFLSFAPRERRPCREGPWQPTLSNANQWHARNLEGRIRPMAVYHVYILANASGVLYTGVTNFLERRVRLHKQKLVD